MIRQTWAAATVCALGLAGCVTSTVPVASRTVDGSFETSGGIWNTGPTLFVVAQAYEDAGRVVVCGVRTKNGATPIEELRNRTVWSTAIVRIGDDRIFQDVSGFSEVAFSTDLTGQTAQCLRSEAPWRAAYAETPVSVRFPRLHFEEDSDGGLRVTFRTVEVPSLAGG